LTAGSPRCRYTLSPPGRAGLSVPGTGAAQRSRCPPSAPRGAMGEARHSVRSSALRSPWGAGSHAWQPSGRRGQPAQRVDRSAERCADWQYRGDPTRREPPRPASSVPPGGWHASTRRGQPSGDAVSAAALTGPPTAAVTAHRSRCGPRASGPRIARSRRGERVEGVAAIAVRRGGRGEVFRVFRDHCARPSFARTGVGIRRKMGRVFGVSGGLYARA